MRHRADHNQAEIVKALRKVGVSVHVTSSVGDGFPDLVCSLRKGVKLLEVKRPGESLTPDQHFFCRFFPVHVVHTVDEALEVFRD